MRSFFWLLMLVFGAITASADPISPNRITVLDGDTIRIDGKKPDYRLVGFNAPETLRAQNEIEATMGKEAADRLQELVNGGDLDFERVPCACKPGTEGTRACNFKRFCGTLKAKGVDVGVTLISEWLAVPFVCGQTGCPKTPNPWRKK